MINRKKLLDGYKTRKLSNATGPRKPIKTGVITGMGICLAMAILTATKDDWVEEHALKILNMWQLNHTPLGRVDDQYLAKLKDDLSSYFDDPLKRSLIETSY